MTSLKYPLKILLSKIPFEFKPGYPSFKKTQDLIRRTEYLSVNEIKEIQFELLKKIVSYSWTNISGYRDLWSAHGFTPAKLRSFEDIKLIPFVTKEMIRDNLAAFSNRKILLKKHITTGGSTGIPFGFYQTRKNLFTEHAFIYHIWADIFPDLTTKTVSTVLRGTKKNKNVVYSPGEGLLLSSFDLTPSTIHAYIEAIDFYQTPILQAYPSSLFLFSKYIKEGNLKMKHTFRCLMLGSEPLYDFQRELIIEIFKAPISHWYGQSEKVVLAANCAHTDSFHVYPQYGITEILHTDDRNADVAQSGEIVGTSFWNVATPFIRYRTMDYAQVGNTGCPKCGRNYLLLDKIEGRLQEFIVGKNRNLVSMTAINMHNDLFNTILQFRFYQDTPGTIVFHYVAPPENDINTARIKKELSEKLGADFDISIRSVPEIARTKNGKLRFLDQKLDIKKYL